jgi:hypothetical protein
MASVVERIALEKARKTIIVRESNNYMHATTTGRRKLEIQADGVQPAPMDPPETEWALGWGRFDFNTTEFAISAVKRELQVKSIADARTKMDMTYDIVSDQPLQYSSLEEVRQWFQKMTAHKESWCKHNMYS